MSDRETRRQIRRETVRLKLQASAEQHFEAGETIRFWALGMTAPIPTNGLQGLVNLTKIAVGAARPMGVLLTDRAVYLVRTGWFRSQVRRVVARYPLSPHPPPTSFDQTSAIRGAITVDDTTVHLTSVQLQSADELVRQVQHAPLS